MTELALGKETEHKPSCVRNNSNVSSLRKSGATRRQMDKFIRSNHQKAIKAMERCADNGLGVLAKPMTREQLVSIFMSCAEMAQNSRNTPKAVQQHALDKLQLKMTGAQIKCAKIVADRFFPEKQVKKIVEEMVAEDEIPPEDKYVSQKDKQDRVVTSFLKNPDKTLGKLIEEYEEFSEACIQQLVKKEKLNNLI